MKVSARGRGRGSFRTRLVVLPLVFFGAVLLLTACEASQIIVVTTFLDGPDANPADGVCEMTVGVGDCSLRAAIDTSNAAAGSKPVTISVPSGTYALTLAGVDDTNAAGDLDVVAGSHGVVLDGATPGVRVDASGREAAFDVRSPLVDLKGIAVTGSSGPGVDVHSGQARMYRGASFANAGAGVRVAAGATLNIESTTLSSNGGGGANVEGIFNASYSTITANTLGGVAGAGTTNAGANVIADQISGPDCSGTVVSNGGYNLDSDGSCGLGGNFDVTAADAQLATLSGALVPFHRPNPGSPAIDVISTGVYCGGPSGPRDATNAARPIGPNCDRGALEANYTSVPTANADGATVGEDGPAANIDVLGNDTDPDAGDVKTVTALDVSVTAGSVTNNGGDVTYDPNGAFESLALGESASDTFDYTMTDGFGNTASATVTVTVTGINDAPTANADTGTVDASGPAIIVDVLSNDTDPDASDTLSVQSVDTTGTLGSVTNNGSNITYDPNDQFANDPNSLFGPAAVGDGTDTFTYTAVDPNGATSTATVTITVTGINHAPGAVDDTANADEDGPAVTVDVLSNDTDADPFDTKSVQAIDTTGTLGSVTNNGSDVTYDPNGAFESLADGATATDTFTYTVVDSNNATDTATVTVTITGQNDGPTAVADTGSVGEDGPPAMVFVLDNDTDPDAGDSKNVQSVDNTGTVGQAQSFGTFVGYDPGSAFNHLTQGATATDTFSYTMVDGAGATSTATVTMTITGVNDSPIANSDLGSVSEDGPGVTIDVLGNDTDPDTGDTKAVDDVNTSTALGSVTNNGSDVTYDPNGMFESLQVGQSATDTFSYRVIDGAGGTSTATVTVTINGQNDAPVAVADSAAANEDGPPVLISVLDNDADADSLETKTVQSVDNTGTLGQATAFGASVGYNPNGAFESLLAGATATDTFTYTMIDSQGATSTATVTVTVTGQNDAPTAVADAAAMNEDASNVAINVLSNDTDPDSGDTKTVQSVGALSNGGSVTNNGTNVTFTPGASFQDLQVGSTRDTAFSYTMVDGAGATSSATVTVTVSGVNDAPVAVNDGTYAGVVGNTKSVLGTTGTGPLVTLTGNVVSQNDTDVDAADTKTASLVSANSANVTVNANGSFEYTPPVGTQNTNVTFTYKVTDSQGADSNAGTVTLNVVERVWYVNNNLGVNGDGRSSSPFNNLASAAATDDAGDHVFLYGGGSTYTGGIALNASEKLHGEPNGLSVTGAATAPIVAAGSTNPTITNASGNGITLANDVDIQRVNVSGASVDGITGANITNATIGANTAISNSGGTELELTGAAGGTIAVGATITNGSAGRAIEIQNRSSGTTTLSGAVGDTGGTGVLLNSNTGATINFTGALTLSTGANAAFTATGGGTVSNSSATTNTLATSTGTALNVSGTTIGSSDLTFQSISANGAANGIVLNSTGSVGGLTVTGGSSTAQGGDNSGGTIQSTSGDAISLTSTQDVSLTNMRLLNIGGVGVQGISASNVSGTNLFRAGRMSNVGSSGSGDGNGISVVNTTTNLTLFSVENSVFQNSLSGTSHVLNNPNGAISARLDVKDSLFEGLEALAVQSNSASNAVVTTNITNNTFRNASANGQGGTAVTTAAGSLGSNTFVVSGNTYFGLNNGIASGANAGTAAFQTTGGLLSGSVLNNTLGTAADDNGDRRGIEVVSEPDVSANGNTGRVDITIEGNILNRYVDRETIFVDLREDTQNSELIIRNNNIGNLAGFVGQVGGIREAVDVQVRGEVTYKLDFLMTNNNITVNSQIIGVNIEVNADASSPGAQTMNAHITNNTIVQNGAGTNLTARTRSSDPLVVLNLNITGNSMEGGAGTLAVEESSGDVNVQQTSGANLTAVNNGVAVSVIGTLDFNVATPPPPAG